MEGLRLKVFKGINRCPWEMILFAGYASGTQNYDLGLKLKPLTGNC